MKYIFVDFDGVLNSDLYVRTHSHFSLVLKPDKMKLLKRIIDSTQAKIVIHTSWRRYWHKESVHWIGKEMNDIFLEYGLWISDKTNEYMNRKESIEDYIRRYNIKDYVVIDDLFIDSTLIKNHFVKVESVYGLTEDHVKQIVEMLKIIK